ncbi:lipocalin family protein [Pedobacter gandavensis]|uniref:lipocalin family protein n=1 Tax=Pedobacter gandavensis TaxID=2679963 RepID=UPI00292FF3D3|nr:lipocalin family protein [Pedobacter gandavensis]
MKKQLTLLTMLFLVIAGITAGCKKETGAARPLKKKIEGKWQVTKIETSIGGVASAPYTGLPADYFEFRNNENDQVEVEINGLRTLGTYATLANDDLNLSLSGKVFNCVVNTITDNSFEFTATQQESNPKEVKKYYLRR